MKIRILSHKGDEAFVLCKENFAEVKQRIASEGLVLVEPEQGEVIDLTGIDWEEVERLEQSGVSELVAIRPVQGG